MITHFTPEDIFHQIQTSLWLMRSQLNYIDTENPEKKESERLVLQKECDRLSELFHHLSYLVFMTHSQDQKKLSTEVVDIKVIVHEVFDIFSFVTTDYDFVCSDLLEKNLQLRTNAFWLKELIHIFVENAFKHSAIGTKIELKLSQNKFGAPQIDITNFGIGISASDQERVWQKDILLNGDAPGLGLGLKIAKTIADQLELDLVLESDGTSYTKFSILFPDFS